MISTRNPRVSKTTRFKSIPQALLSLTWRRRSTRGARACRRGHRGRMPPRRETDNARIGDDGDYNPRAPPLPLSPPRLDLLCCCRSRDHRRTCFNARYACLENGSERWFRCVSRERGHYILISSHDRRRFVRCAAREWQFHRRALSRGGEEPTSPHLHARSLARRRGAR